MKAVVLQFLNPVGGSKASPVLDWEDFDSFPADTAFRKANIATWSKAAPGMGRRWRIIERDETILEDGQ